MSWNIMKKKNWDGESGSKITNREKLKEEQELLND